MYIIDLVRSAADKFAPKTEHPRAVVGVIVLAIGLVGCYVLWARVPGQSLQKSIETLLIVAAILFLPDLIIQMVRKRRDKKELETMDEQPDEDEGAPETEWELERVKGHPTPSYENFIDGTESDFDKYGPPPN